MKRDLQKQLLDAATQKFQEYFAKEWERILQNPNADGWIRLIEILEKARNDKRVLTSAGATDFLGMAIELASDSLTASTADQAIEPLNDVLPLAIHGKIMRDNEKKNPGGPVRKRIAKELAKNSDLMPRHLWELIEAKHPKNWDVDRATREIWVTGRPQMGYSRFSEVCKEERDKLRA